MYYVTIIANLYQLACVVAIPLELKGRNVYMSWNFETNFYYPYFDNVQGLVPLPFATIDEEDTNLGTFVVHAQQNQQRALTNQTDEANDDDSSSRALKSKASDDDVWSSTTTKVPLKISRKPRQILDYFMTRRRLYRIIESKLKGYVMHNLLLVSMTDTLINNLFRLGLNGRHCLLKSICEAAAHPVNTYNGVLGDILHVVFT